MGGWGKLLGIGGINTSTWEQANESKWENKREREVMMKAATQARESSAECSVPPFLFHRCISAIYFASSSFRSSRITE